MSRSSEDALIARYFAPLATLPGSERLIDDAALISPSAGHVHLVERLDGREAGGRALLGTAHSPAP